MKTNYLLPKKWKIIGWILLLIGLILGTITLMKSYEVDWFSFKVIALYNEPFSGAPGFFQTTENSLFDELACLLIILGGMLVAFSKEKVEDEFINKLRKDSLVWALIVNYLILVLAVICVYDITFFHILVFNMFTPILFYIFRFNFLKLKSRSDEE